MKKRKNKIHRNITTNILSHINYADDLVSQPSQSDIPLVIFLNLRGTLVTWRFLFGDAIGGQCDRYP